MIKANELRIGNWVINPFGKQTQFREDDYGFKNRGEFFNAVPLTEEWLLKFGFQRHDEGSVSAQFSYGTNPVTQDYLIYLKWIKDYENDYQLNGFPFYQNGHFEIKTVHQLQNLFFSLCGEELNVK